MVYNFRAVTFIGFLIPGLGVQCGGTSEGSDVDGDAGFSAETPAPSSMAVTEVWAWVSFDGSWVVW